MSILKNRMSTNEFDSGIKKFGVLQQQELQYEKEFQTDFIFRPTILFYNQWGNKIFKKT